MASYLGGPLLLTISLGGLFVLRSHLAQTMLPSKKESWHLYRREESLIGFVCGPREEKVEMSAVVLGEPELTGVASLMAKVVMFLWNALKLFGISVDYGLQHHVNAKQGGHRISNNQIGTRGSDKVVHVPLGTVIHLVSGETPSFIEDKSTSSLNPWDIPIITDEELQTNHENASNEISNPPEPLTNRAEECISSEKKQSWDWRRKWKR